MKREYSKHRNNILLCKIMSYSRKIPLVSFHINFGLVLVQYRFYKKKKKRQILIILRNSLQKPLAFYYFIFGLAYINNTWGFNCDNSMHVYSIP
jgi:hypothetical protein